MTTTRRAAMRQVASTALMTLGTATMARAQAPSNAAPAVSTIAGDERIDFFTTAARRSGDGRVWIVPIHARVFRPVRSTVRKNALAALLKQIYGIIPSAEAGLLMDDRLNLLLGDNKGGRRIVVTIAGGDYPLPATKADGHVSTEVTIPAATLAYASSTGRIHIQAKLERRDPRTFTGTVLLLEPAGRSIISDIDDTVKITHVADRARMMDATFNRPFEAVPGMARLYQAWASEGASLHFVSSTPWHFYRPLTDFLEEAGFPDATMTLKQIRLKDSSITNILADATATKPPGIEAILKHHPKRTFVLVGDSGEKDPEIYTDIARRFPGRVEHIFIRNVTAATRDDSRFTQAFAGFDPARWMLFDDPAALPTSLGRQ